MSEREHLHAAVKELLNRVFATTEDDWSWDGKPLSQPLPASGERGVLATPAPKPLSPFTGRGWGEGIRSVTLDSLSNEVEACRACPLGSTRLKPAFGVGSPTAEVMFIGEGPGYEEDHRGEPFVGKAGQLLDKIIGSIGLSRETVYIANIVKCHPMVDPSDPEKRGNDRPPTAEEMAACRHFLDEQIALIKPKVIVTLGNVPTRVLLDTTEGISKLRGKWKEYTPKGAKAVKLLPTFHPAALLRDPNLKKDVWEDMKALRNALK